jgi:alkyl hydroperoxide reductase subunit F
MLDATLKTQLSAYLEKLQLPIQLNASLDQSEGSLELSELLNEIAELSDKVSFAEVADERTPSFEIRRVGTDIAVRFAGVPLGHEFSSLVLALLQVGGHPPREEAEVLEQARALTGDFVFETYFSLSCHNCPDVVQALNLLAVVNPGVKHVAIDGALFQDEVERRQVMAVPSIYLNGQPFGSGRMTLAEILAKADTGAATRAAEMISAKAPFDMLVVGGGPAGASSAIYAARKGIRTGVLAERFGGQVADTLGIENFTSVSQTEGPKLVAQMEQHVKDYEVDVMQLQRASRLIAADDDGLIEILLENGASLRSRSVVLSTGARWREMGVPGEAEYRNKGVAYCPHCDGPLFRGKRVAVIGGGNSGAEAAIDLAGIVSHVTLIEFDTKLRADEVLQRKLRSLSNVSVLLNAQTTEVLGDGSRVSALQYRDRGSLEQHAIELEGIFVQIGLLPNTDWLKGSGVAMSPRGEIEIDAHGKTSLAGVYAAGDCTTVPYKQIIIAMGAGATAALGAFDHLMRSSVPVKQAQAA